MEEVSKVLKEDQVKRLKQIMIQVAGVNAFSQKDVQDGLKLTDEQKDTIKEISASMQEERREMMQGAFGGGAGGGERPSAEEMQKRMAEMQKKGAELTKKYMEKVKNQLKDEQKTAWAEMVGKDFDYKPEMPQRRRDN
jgi:predicted HicB family RNase H-like nuclease